MKGVAKKSGIYRKEPEIPCGTPTNILAKFPFQVPSRCERWECDNCREKKIRDKQKLLLSSALAATVYICELDPIRTMKEKYTFKNFLTRKIVGEYWWFRSNLRTILITRCDNPGATRMSTKYVIEKLIPEVLNEPFAWLLKDRFGKSRYDNKKRNNGKIVKPEDKKKSTDNPVYATHVSNKEKTNAVFYECRNFRGDDYKWYQWLKKHQYDPEIEVCKEGYKLIKRFEVENSEASAVRQAAPPRYAL